MAQEPFGDAHPRQPWPPRSDADWPNGGYGGYAEQQQAPEQPSPWQPQAGHGPAEYGQQQPQAGQGDQVGYGHSGYDHGGYGQGGYGQGGYGHSGYDQSGYGHAGYDQGGHGRTGQAEGGYVQGQYGEQGQYQPYPPYQDHPLQHQPYAPYAAAQQPAGDGLYVPAGAEYSADGYVHIEEAEPAPAPVPEEPAETSPQAPGVTAEPVAPSRAAARRGAGGGSGTAAGSGSALSARARKAAGAVLTGDHVPSRKALLVRTGAGVAALGVLAVAGLMVGTEGGGSAAASSGGEPGFAVAHTRAWAAQPAAAGPAGGDDTLVGSWPLADAVVRADGSGVHAYDRAGGKLAWSVEPPAAGAVPCGLSAGVNQAGLGAALFRPQADPKSPCTLVVAVDTKTGRTAWTKALSDAKGAYSARVGVTEDKVIAVGDDRVLAWESADGKDVWQYTGQGKFCTLSGGVSGKTVLVASSCADSTPADQAVALNTADGKVSWWRGLNNQPKTVTVLSAEPAVVLTTGEKPENDRVFAWGTAGDPAAEIPVAVDGGRLDVAHGTFSATPGVYFEGRTMVTTLTPPNGGGQVAAVGYDLDTGKQRWKVPTAAKGAVRAVGIDGGSLVLAADERRDQPARLSRFPLAGGQEATGGNFPSGTGSLLISGRVLIGGGQVVVVPEHSTNYGTAAGYQAKD
ncbi:PQQ-binding-like beta-propeller repeat protein [Kitasatospora sp. NPDC001547]|uniref:outer membrane protein assembly factor BamB family protein n=1 Tax=Kitasatospora sp. NPDC001547 TaxID=3364015 RepID=UPI003684FA8D